MTTSKEATTSEEMIPTEGTTTTTEVAVGALEAMVRVMQGWILTIVEMVMGMQGWISTIVEITQCEVGAVARQAPAEKVISSSDQFQTGTGEWRALLPSLHR